MNRLGEAAEPLRALIRVTPADQRNGLLSALPRLFERAADKRQSAQTLAQVLEPYLAQPATRTAARVALGRAWLAADDGAKALALAESAQADDPQARGPVLLAIELIRNQPQAERLVTQHLARPGAEPALRLAYVRLLTATQRYADAIAQLEVATREQPDNAPPFLTLGALHLELRHFAEADAALQRYLALAVPAAGAAAAPAPAASATGADADEDTPVRADQGAVQAWLMLAQSAEQRGDFSAAEAWLARIEDPQRALDVQARRASLMARQGRIDDAVKSLRQVPERNADDARAKLVAEAQMLRDVKRWQAAHDVFERANARFADDVDLLYEQAMMAEKINRIDDMERLLRRVIALKPDHGHAHNALGYSLADRGLRLAEARELIQRALDLRPGDPFITDSLGWVEFRLGNREEALRLLRTAWAARPDTEIGAHLGEVLWSLGRQDEARAIWREARSRDAANEVLRETLARLQVGL
jgi:tetratricopeptide (TPR) repeat protein